ncbi:hypothetical protein, partial [Nocardioides malaquae]|uniref:hypothetical protein n=1 Tax=Nocardioides malaquae TaxID=2773426 RepID=UPI001D0D009F
RGGSERMRKKEQVRQGQGKGGRNPERGVGKEKRVGFLMVCAAIADRGLPDDLGHVTLPSALSLSLWSLCRHKALGSIRGFKALLKQTAGMAVIE